MKKVSLIVINYNGRDFIANCLRALEGQRLKDFESVLIDNASTDVSLDEIETFLRGSLLSSHVKLIPLKINMGFAGGNLEGLRNATGVYIAILNHDTEPDKEWLEELVKAMDSDSTAGICASNLIAC